VSQTIINKAVNLLSQPRIGGLVRLSHFSYAPPDQEKLEDYELRFLKNRPVIGDEKLLLHGHVHSQWLY